MSIFGSALSKQPLWSIKKFPAYKFFKYHNKFGSKRMSTICNKFNYPSTSKPLDPILFKLHKKNHKFKRYISTTDEFNKNQNKLMKIDDDDKNDKKSAKILPIVFHQLTDANDKSVSVALDKDQHPQWIETDSVEHATRSIEKFAKQFLRNQNLKNVKDKEDDEDEYEFDESENDNQSNENNMKYIDKTKNNEVLEDIISFKLDPAQFNNLPISSMNLKFDMEVPDLIDVLEKTQDLKNTNTIPLGFNATINGIVDLDDSKVDTDKLGKLEFDQLSQMVSSLAANICSVALQKVIAQRLASNDMKKFEKKNKEEDDDD